MKPIAPLFQGPLDVVGDIHGEAEALERLAARLGYDERGAHREGRRLVFLGDLSDRGPDSPAVLERVSSLVAAGRAQCLLGNHELNLLRDVPKHGNDWWTRPEKRGRLPAVPVTPAEKQRYTAFLETLPVALEREDLRLVHACWSPAAVDELRARGEAHPGTLALYHEYVADYRRRWDDAARDAALAAEREGIDLRDDATTPPFLPLLARRDADYQVSNPLTVLTSGLETPAAAPFWAGGRWRMVERVKWWESYGDDIPVVVGHYWRRFSDAPSVWADKYGPDLFEGVEPHQWMGARRNVYCVDFSVGGRAEQRHRGAPEHLCQLAALRLPEWQVIHDGGETWEIGPPGR